MSDVLDIEKTIGKYLSSKLKIPWTRTTPPFTQQPFEGTSLIVVKHVNADTQDQIVHGYAIVEIWSTKTIEYTLTIAHSVYDLLKTIGEQTTLPPIKTITPNIYTPIELGDFFTPEKGYRLTLSYKAIN